jgi:hypothetical protein
MSGSLSITSAGTKVYMSATLPTTYDETGFGALTWVALGDVSSLGAFGGKANVVKFTPIDTNIVAKRVGSVDMGTVSLQIARHIGADATAITAAFADHQPRAFKVVYPTALGETDAFTGVITSMQTNVGNSDNILQWNVDVEIDNTIITY